MTNIFNRTLIAVSLMAVAVTPRVGVQSQTKPTSAVRSWESTELWRVDGSTGGDPFGDLRDFVVVRDGALWVLDFKDQNIRRFDAQGKPLSTVGRKGSGPGELGNANGMLVAPDGMVWVNDPRNARLSVYKPDGTFSHQLSVSQGGYGYRWQAAFDVTNKALIDQAIGQQRVWNRRDEKGALLGTVPYASCPSSGEQVVGGYKAETKGKGASYGSYPFTTGGGIALDGDGGVWCASPRAHRVARLRVGTNDTLATTTVDVGELPVADEERATQIASIEKRIAQYATTDFDKSKIPTTKPGIDGLFVDDDHRLWVLLAGAFRTKTRAFDVFDAKGKHLGRVQIPAKMPYGLLMRARGDALWAAVVDEDDVPSVVRYRLRR